VTSVALRLLQGVAPLVPRQLRHPLGGALGEITGRRIVRRLSVLARGGAPIVAGPWLGEVGFELLYWVPFLNWFVERFAIAPDRMVVMSRGGTRDWYRSVAASYRDVLDQMPPGEFRERNVSRASELGEQKQVRMTAFEQELLRPVLTAAGVDEARVLHPSLMYALMRSYWWGHANLDWVERYTRFRRFEPPTSVPGLDGLPREYTAVKFYYNESFPATPANQAFARRVLSRLRAERPVVSLSTGLALDDHEGWEDEESLAAYGIRATLSPAKNLALQSAVVGGARAWAGTYGGFAYLAPFYGVRAEAYYSEPGGYSPWHLDLARHVFRGFSDTELLHVSQVA
jgi:hypothetical protein